ncbi:hypothetical protein BH747_01865 [Enterococcus villorum]|uniref:Hydrolase n=1 Tax=Enterococcus villorum TaxID=112904 RepID=A0A1V8YU82_9ENTE|nr:hypothetical protein [Enterococcus villorum]OQO71601.1 hypothetical protein BH747_01865 [Enterococcus villorum]OQO76165.1 hypothetical protein BH744_04270 [Enterococcus villorum]
MDRIKFPDKYENLIRLAQKKIVDQEYFQAKDLLQRAYELNATFEANRLLVFCLFEMDEKKEALNQALPHERDYLAEEKAALFYFDLLIQTNDYLYARKLIASSKYSDSFEQSLLTKIQQAENFMSQNERQKLRAIHQDVARLPSMSPMEQLVMIQQMEELPYRDLVQTIKKLIIMPKNHLFARAKMLESLVKVKYNQPISYLTIEDQLIEVVPETLPRPDKQLAYQQLMALAEKYEDQNTQLSALLKEEFTMQCALLYPIYDRYVIDSKKWFADTLRFYAQTDEKKQITEENRMFMEKRKNIFNQIRLFQESF